MIQIADQAKFETVVKTAIEQTADNYRWQNAVKKAAEQIEENGAFMTFDEQTETLLIWSQQSNQIYESNGVCQCKAYNQGFPCFHRAAARLMKNYLKVNKPTADDPDNAPYIKQLNRKTEKCGNIRF